MSYIVKNCPSYEYGFCTSPRINEQGCRNCTDCIVKQVINYCLEQNLKYDTTACDILQLFNIEEINR